MIPVLVLSPSTIISHPQRGGPRSLKRTATEELGHNDLFSKLFPLSVPLFLVLIDLRVTVKTSDGMFN